MNHLGLAKLLKTFHINILHIVYKFQHKMEIGESYSENCIGIRASSEDMFASSQESDIPHTSAENLCRTDQFKSKISPGTREGWRGTPISKLVRNIGHSQFPPVVPGQYHSVLFKLPVKDGEVPESWPDKPVDVWDQNHVRMPHSPSSLYPVTPTELKTRWELVKESLCTPIHTSHQLQAAILHYNSKYSERWDFTVLHSFFSQALEEEETEHFFKKVLPNIIDLALSLPKVVTGGIPLLRKHRTHSVSLTQQQISCLLANAFLCTFPRRNTSKKDSEYSSFPCINFNRLFNGDFAKDARIPCIHEKLKCFINYFRRVTNKVPDGVVTFSRHHLPSSELPQWNSQTARLLNLHITSEGTIEDQGTGMLQMDFANKMVGGGVLGRGCVQEEIRFAICPELIIARLFTEVLDETEALVINGCERFSLYRGYSDDFEWAGNCEDQTPRDSYGRRFCTVVAIDATRFPNPKVQYSIINVNRELNKAYAGFSWGMKNDVRESVATGNWGCGAFKGDATLKSLLQLMAAAVAGRDVVYFTFGNDQLRDQVADMHSFLTQRQVTVGHLWKIMTDYNPLQHRYSLYDHIYKSFNPSSIPAPINSKALFTSKKSKVEKNVEENQAKKPHNNGQGMSVDEIEHALESVKDLMQDETDEWERVKPLEAKTLSLQSDKELCLKRLSSSWNNLNESKKDFSCSESARTPQLASPSTEVRHSGDTYMQNNTKKKKISDYFQPASKS